MPFSLAAVIGLGYPTWMREFLGWLAANPSAWSPISTFVAAIVATIGVVWGVSHSRRAFKTNLQAETMRAGMEVVWKATVEYHKQMNRAAGSPIAASSQGLAQKYQGLWALQFNQYYYWKGNLIPEGIYRSWMEGKRDWIRNQQPPELADLPAASFQLIETFHDDAFELFMREVFGSEEMSEVMKRAKRRKPGKLGRRDGKRLAKLKHSQSAAFATPPTAAPVPASPPPAPSAPAVSPPTPGPTP